MTRLQFFNALFYHISSNECEAKWLSKKRLYIPNQCILLKKFKKNRCQMKYVDGLIEYGWEETTYDKISRKLGW